MVSVSILSTRQQFDVHEDKALRPEGLTANTPRQAIRLRDVSVPVREALGPDCTLVVLCDYLHRKEYESSA
jgi:hypothetical protein